MTDTIQDHQKQDVEDRTASSTSTSGSSPTKSKLPLVLAVGGAAALLAVAAIAFWPESSSKPATTEGFASGTSVDVVLTCASSAPCSGGVTAPDGSQWFWSTTVDQSIPAEWQSHQITGTLVTDGDWGTVTYTSGGETVSLYGGMATPEHSYFG